MQSCRFDNLTISEIQGTLQSSPGYSLSGRRPVINVQLDGLVNLLRSQQDRGLAGHRASRGHHQCQPSHTHLVQRIQNDEDTLTTEAHEAGIQVLPPELEVPVDDPFANHLLRSHARAYTLTEMSF